MIPERKKILASMFALACLTITWTNGADGVLPVGADGQPIDLGFEAGDLRNWTAEGAAFSGQPVKGDTVAPRRSDMKSDHEGDFWIGTFERDGDAPKGVLTSVSFKVTHPFASFLVAGGSTEATRVEVVSKAVGKAIATAVGEERENLRPFIVDLSDHQGEEIFIRVVDDASGGWGHVNFDHFVFHAAKPEFENEITAQEVARNRMPSLDMVKFAGLDPASAAREATMPEGFKMHVFAAEPDVRQPIAFCLDDRGRVWVAEGLVYPRRQPEGEGIDRILIFEDTDGDHEFDKQTVFKDGLNLVSGLQIGFGGVWVGAAPYLMFIPDRDGDDVPDDEAEILLDGWDYLRDTHETLNTFTWGPDGWLYGCHGVFCPSHVGKPGTPMEDRQRVDAGVWRYHPVRHEFEVFAEGTSNPWGIDFDANGECIIEACVIPHLWHMVQGGRFQRQGGQHYSVTLDETRRNRPFLAKNSPQYLNPFVYDDIKTIGDHVHYAGNKGPHAGNNRSDEVGGGHAHAGLMIYQGDSWPESLRNKVYMNNIHGQRINQDVLTRHGSGYRGSHGEDLINFQDTWSQILHMISDQDGSVYMIDWYDQNQCHHNQFDGHDRSNGRIFKVVYNNEPVTRIDLAKLSDLELVKLQNHPNVWHQGHSRRILQERAAIGRIGLDAIRSLNDSLSGATGQTALRLMWTAHAIGQLDDRALIGLTEHDDDIVRGWAIQLLFETGTPSRAALRRVAAMSENDSSAWVRRYIASALQRIDVPKRLPALRALVAKADDADDHNLPLLYWYAMEPVVGSDREAALELLKVSEIPQLRRYIARRMTAVGR